MRNTTWRALARGGIVAVACVAAACADRSVKELRVRRAYLVMPAGSSPGTMYFTVENDGVWADTLISVSTPAAAKAELHETTAMAMAASDAGAARRTTRAAASPAAVPTTGMMTMVPSSLVIVRAHSVTRFAPGGQHVMLMSPIETLKRGDTVAVTFVFMRRGQLRARATVITYADVDTATAAPAESSTP